MLLTSLFLSSLLPELTTVKSQLVVTYKQEHIYDRSLRAELARFEDAYGRQFTVIRGVCDSAFPGGLFSIQGYAVCRYNNRGILDRALAQANGDSSFRNPKSKWQDLGKGEMAGDSFVSEYRGVGPVIRAKVLGYGNRATYFSLLEAVVLFNYRPSSEPVQLLNLMRLNGDPAVLSFRFVHAQPTGAMSETGFNRELLVAATPSVSPGWTRYAEAIDSLGTVYLSSFGFVHSDGHQTKPDQHNVFHYDGAPVQNQGQLTDDILKEMRGLIPDDWRTPPVD